MVNSLTEERNSGFAAEAFRWGGGTCFCYVFSLFLLVFFFSSRVRRFAFDSVPSW